ncbi:MAG TPA: L-lysine 6-transaminase [Thermoanaerobaculia bacterium]|nr:L-lysine 6-transaminase [Thermoanaerobaculia bacterium]HQR66478.1 L-lysine 6-transaminase [Thermoanaerobaculia bacterium]
MAPLTSPRIDSKSVLENLSRHMLVDGYHVVMDLARSRGNVVYDALHDAEILDFFSQFATCPVGYNHPKMSEPGFLEELTAAAVTKPANSDIYTRQMAEFVEAFTRIAVPASHGRHLFFVEGGALANENQLKAAFDWKVRKNFRKGYRREVGTKILHFEQAFHGRSGYTLSLTNTADPRKTMYFPKFDWPRVVNPKLSFPVTPENLEKTIAKEKLAVRQIEQALVDHPDDIAALIIEPIQGEGGDNHFRPEFFRTLRSLCDENEMLFLVDEVQTGLGLTGAMWGFEPMGAVPDMFSFGKKTQVCGFASNDRILEEPENVFAVSSRINSTWGGNLVDMVRCRRYLEIIAEENLVENARVVGEFLLSKLVELSAEFPGKMTNVRGRGLFIAFDLPDGKARGQVLATWLQKHRVMGLASGERAIRLRPPLTLTKDEALLGVQRLRAALAETVG